MDGAKFAHALNAAPQLLPGRVLDPSVSCLREVQDSGPQAAAVLALTGLLLAIVSLDQPNGMPRLLPYNWVAILFPPAALGCIALGLSLMVAEVSGR